MDAINALCGDGPQFYSLHLDVEPHVLPEVKRDGMEGYIPRFVELIRDARAQADKRGRSWNGIFPPWSANSMTQKTIAL